MPMDGEVYQDIIDSLRSKSWGDIDSLQTEISEQFPEVSPQSIRSILCQVHHHNIDPFPQQFVFSGISKTHKVHLQTAAQ